MENWREIWSKTRHLPDDRFDLAFLIDSDGFNSGAGLIEVDDWKNYMCYINKLIELEPNDSLFEVGCGSGAFLYTFYTKGHQVSGIDYSPSLIDIASYVMPQMNFAVQDANLIDTERKFDIVIANSVFQYFPDYDYAEQVIMKMCEKANKAVVILDVNDNDFLEEAVRIRKGSLSEGEYERKYAGYQHLYFDRAYFINLLKDKGYSVQTSNQNINNYGNNKFRFNVVIKK